MKPFDSVYIPLGGGIDGTSPVTQMPPGRLRLGLNVEAKPGGGYRRAEGYTAFDDAPVPGEGDVLGVWHYNSKVYAFRNVAGGATASMYSSVGSGWATEKTGLAPSGTYRFVNHAFSGTQKMYGVSGKHKAFEWDGAAWTDITTGMTADTPTEIAAHRQHLFLSFDNSVQHSALGNPTSWSPVTGAGEILLPDTVTGFSTMPNGSLGIFTRNGITVLAGSSSSDWVANNMVEYGNNAGAISGTVQAMGSNVRFCDSRGVIDLSASDTSSDFYDAIITHDVDDLYENQWKAAISSVVVRAKSQYRLFFPDRTGLNLTFTGSSVMITRMEWPNKVVCTANSEDASGNEVIYFGSDDGRVYQMENGRSFGGAAIRAYAETSLMDMGLRHNVKRFKRCRFDIEKDGDTSLYADAKFMIDDGGIRSIDRQPPAYLGSGQPLGTKTLGNLLLGGAVVSEGSLDIPGIAQWVAIRFGSETDNEAPWEINGISIDFKPGRKRR